MWRLFALLRCRKQERVWYKRVSALHNGRYWEKNWEFFIWANAMIAICKCLLSTSTSTHCCPRCLHLSRWVIALTREKIEKIHTRYRHFVAICMAVGGSQTNLGESTAAAMMVAIVYVCDVFQWKCSSFDLLLELWTALCCSLSS